MILTKITKLQKLILKGKVLYITSKSVYVSLNITPRYIHNQQAQSKYKQSVLWSLKNYIHVKKLGTPQNFFLVFTDELENQIFIKKTVELGQ